MANGGRLLVTLVLREMPYAEYLQTNHWREIRLRTLRLAGYRCQLCRAPERLDVHHISYLNLGAEPPADVMALCHGPNKCHALHHETLRHVMHAEQERLGIR